MLFGGANGFNLFQPKSIKNDQSKPVIVLSDLLLANRSVDIGGKIDGNILLNQAIGFTKEIRLNYRQNGVTLSFAALNYFNPKKIRYKYRLEGFDKHWQEPQNDNRSATYTNIDPGEYVFKVRSTDGSGNWGG
ncbi:triple tyrosine motif-containing protein [Pedobacter sp. NJ-S-72]